MLYSRKIASLIFYRPMKNCNVPCFPENHKNSKLYDLTKDTRDASATGPNDILNTYGIKKLLKIVTHTICSLHYQFYPMFLRQRSFTTTASKPKTIHNFVRDPSDNRLEMYFQSSDDESVNTYFAHNKKIEEEGLDNFVTQRSRDVTVLFRIEPKHSRLTWVSISIPYDLCM